MHLGQQLALWAAIQTVTSGRFERSINRDGRRESPKTLRTLIVLAYDPRK
jgi:hypothetical protein